MPSVRRFVSLDITRCSSSLDPNAANMGTGIPIFALSTYDTDYVLVKSDRLERAEDALRSAGHSIRQ